MESVSFFTPKNFLGCIIRGKQIADYLGGQYNPTCIYVKPISLEHIRDCDIVDVSDGEYVTALLQSRPKIRVIVHSLHTYELLKQTLRNPIIWISQQHLNWKNERRERTGVERCGYIGKNRQSDIDYYNKIGAEIKKCGFDFLHCYNFTTREDAVAFYKQIDILVIAPFKGSPYKTPTKMINAASFGIPSVAYPLDGYKEWEGKYVRAETVEKMLEELAKFKDEQYYRDWATLLIEAAEPYHISRVAERYKAL